MRLRLRCPVCNEKLDQMPTLGEFDSKIECMCPMCDELYIWDTIMEEFEDIPGEGCKACGNPAYPHCKASCPMFDD